MLAGATPFTGPTVQALITRRFTEPVPSVRAARPEVTGELERVVTKSLAKAPEERFASAAQVVQALGSPRMVTPQGTPAGGARRDPEEVDRGAALRGHEPPEGPGLLL